MKVKETKTDFCVTEETVFKKESIDKPLDSIDQSDLSEEFCRWWNSQLKENGMSYIDENGKLHTPPGVAEQRRL